MAQNSVNLLIDLKKKKPDVSGEDATVYWYKSHVNYDYEKDPKILHTQNSGTFLQPNFTLFLVASVMEFCGRVSKGGRFLFH